MNIKTRAGLMALCLVSLLLCRHVSAQEFRSLLSSNQANIPNVYQGSFTSGNTITHVARHQNISSRTFVINSVTGIRSFDPEDLGFPDLTPQNGTAIAQAMFNLLPTYDLFNSTGWVQTDPIRMIWNTEITFTTAFPIVVPPGGTFEYTRVSRNQFLGPEFGPVTAPATETTAHLIGELAVGFEFDWYYVPEPHLCGLLALATPAIALRRRSAHSCA